MINNEWFNTLKGGGKMTFDEATHKAYKIMMVKYDPEGLAGVSKDWATIDKYREEYRKLVQSFMDR